MHFHDSQVDTGIRYSTINDVKLTSINLEHYALDFILSFTSTCKESLIKVRVFIICAISLCFVGNLLYAIPR